VGAIPFDPPIQEAEMTKTTRRGDVLRKSAGYRPDYCEAVVAVMGRGHSLMGFAGEIGVARSTLTNWIKAHPEFAEAVERGKAARTRALEAEFLTAGTGAKVAAQVFALKNAAPEDWNERPGGDRKAETAVVEMPANGRDTAAGEADGQGGHG
jgi:hypothetical protein